jgi:hypothetical protein
VQDDQHNKQITRSPPGTSGPGVAFSFFFLSFSKKKGHQRMLKKQKMLKALPASCAP